MTMSLPRYYFAGRYQRISELREYRDELETAIGLPGLVVSRWLDQVSPNSFTVEELTTSPERGWAWGGIDKSDLLNADTIVSFTEKTSGGHGGRHVEHGMALLLHLRIVIVGPRENVFHCYPPTEVFTDWKTFLAHEKKRYGTQE